MRWKREVPLAALTRLGIGGPTPRLGLVRSEEELRRAFGRLDGARHLVLGGGANVLVADAGVEEAVILLEGEFDYVTSLERTLEVGAAAKLPALVGAARREGRAGWSFLEAVPGTVGGGLRMNAGSRDEWMWHRVRWAEAMRPGGEVVRIAPDEAAPGYRSVGVPSSWVFLRAELEAPPGAPAEVAAAHRSFRSKKVAAQVYDLPSVGSIWKNPGPPYGSAWEVVGRVGMRGARRGGAQVAERHANFIVNVGGAKAEDVVALMLETRRRAREELGVLLEPEIVLWGFDEETLRALGAGIAAERAR